MKLNDTAIRKIKPVEGKTIHKPDGGGLFLVVLSSGAKIWKYRYKLFNKDKKIQLSLSLGSTCQYYSASVWKRKLSSVAQAIHIGGITKNLVTLFARNFFYNFKLN